MTAMLLLEPVQSKHTYILHVSVDHFVFDLLGLLWVLHCFKRKARVKIPSPATISAFSKPNTYMWLSLPFLFDLIIDFNHRFDSL